MKIELKILNKEFYTPSHISTDNMKTWETRYKDLPQYATSGAAGVDLRATSDVDIYPGETKAIPTGLALHIGSSLNPSEGFQSEDMNFYIMGMVVPRSGLGTEGLVLANTIGIIDEDYQGEIIIQAWNRKNSDMPCKCCKIEIKAGDRIAQLVFVPIIKAQWQIVEEFSRQTERGAGGFGSTDK